MKTICLAIACLFLAYLPVNAQDYAGSYSNDPFDWEMKSYNVTGLGTVQLVSTESTVKMNKGVVRFTLKNTYLSGDVLAAGGMLLVSTDKSTWNFVDWLYDSNGNPSSGQMGYNVEYSIEEEVTLEEQYYYAVGNSWGIWVGGGSGNPRSLTVVQGIDGTPKPPTSLAKTIQGSNQVLSWTASVVNGNNAGMVGYNIYRAPGGMMDPIKINTTPVTGTSYSIPAVTGGQVANDNVYVRAVDATIHLTDPTNSVVCQFRGSELESIENPDAFYVTGNYPNPFNPSTKLNVNLVFDSPINFTAYNLIGQQVVSFEINGKAGLNILEVNASSLPTGNYLYKVSTSNGTKTGTMNLLK